MTNPASESEAEFSSPHLTVSAPAKINLILRILDRRPDGYHNLWSIMQTVALKDEIQLQTCHETRDIQLRCDAEELATDHGNLVYRAARAVLDRARADVGLDIGLKKTIPMGAGLGGGSSDAAATIVGLNRLLQLGWSQAQMAEIGQSLGSDVPFFLFAPSAVVSGRGENVKPVRLRQRRWTVLVNPGFSIETKWAYQELTATRKGVRPLTELQKRLDGQLEMDWQQVAEAAENDFETPIFAKHGILADIKQALLTSGAEAALLSGSGATVFGIFKDEGVARAAAGSFAGRDRIKTFVVSTCSGPLTAQ
ncbi:MAG TPA: 4-(cytidine 5'-diphospho)-2-C-methyl-D-erythritol kinase [Nitrospira sp.]|nr:4-(cytidine 5'-diphospho)-2-C-methyl-D-erythritol kinase [Nitrospira sp.]